MTTLNKQGACSLNIQLNVSRVAALGIEESEMAFVELSKQESAGTKKVADVERWLLVEI